MKKMKTRALLQTVLLVGLLAALMLSLAACGGGKKSQPTQPTEPTTITEATEPTQAPTKPTSPIPTVDPATCMHLYPEWVVDQEATCQAKGSRHQECNACGTKWPAEEIASILCDPGPWVTKREASCMFDGVMQTECTMCKKVMASVSIAKIDHSPGEWIVDSEPTATEVGRTHLECAVCRETIEEMEVPATGSLGLEVERNPDGKTFTVTGIGVCNDTRIYIPEVFNDGTITAIGSEAFANCTDVEKIVLPNSIVSIGRRAFYNTGLKEFVIPASVKEVGAQIFYKAQNLNTVYYDSDYANESTAIFGATTVKEVIFRGTKVPDYVCQGASELKKIKISTTVKSIGDHAFEDCTSLAQVDIPDSVISVGDAAFKNCTGMTSVVIPDSISSIGAETFAGCTSLPSITIPDSVIRIEDRAFAKCTNLSVATIPASITKFGDEAFADCPKLQTIHFMGSQSRWNGVIKGTNWDKNTGKYTVRCYG